MSMNQVNDAEMEIQGYKKIYDYTQYAHENDVNVIPVKSFQRLVEDTFTTITEVLKETYGPYGSTILISDQNETVSTKDGYNIYSALGFNHHYKRKVYLALLKICDRVNRTVGDGTTSCILLADKIFSRINSLLDSPENKRLALNVLNRIESKLQDYNKIQEDLNDGTKIKKLNNDSLMSIINVSSNYDKQLCSILSASVAPTYDEYDNISTIRNVIVEPTVNYSSDIPEYSYEHLPGEYRVRVLIDQDKWWVFANPTVNKMAVYEGTFGSVQWDNFMDNWDKESTVIVASKVSNKFLENEYLRYMKQCALNNVPLRIFIIGITGGHEVNEARDLAAVIGTTPIKNADGPIDHSTLPKVEMTIHNGNVLCLYKLNKPTEYINNLITERDNGDCNSIVRMDNFNSRIRALSLDNRDTVLKVHCTSTLESKVIKDKLDDCISIINSGLKCGTVPIMFAYGKSRIKEMINDNNDELYNKILQAIVDSLNDLFMMIVESKYTDDHKIMELVSRFNDNTQYKSFDIVSEEWVGMESLCTSSQYDIEVISAAISIVKYLLTSRGMIFDAHLIQMHGDAGHYEMG